MSSSRSTWSAGVALLVGTATLVLQLFVVLHGQIAVRNQGFVPFSDEPINYRSDPDDPVSRLQRRLDRGEASLSWEPRNGYLESVLGALGISPTSQMLVFSKTSFQYRKISPATPRALYFNDDVYVGKVHDGKAIEVISFDASKGAIFYLLDEHQTDRPAFQRAELDCTVCHVAPTTRNVPGVLVRSIYATPSGGQAPRTPAYITGHESPLAERFGGWYVTGGTGAQSHLGNAVVNDAEHPLDVVRDANANLTTLADRIDTSAYLTPYSDVVAQLVHAHQTQAHNLMTQTSFQTRIALFEQAAHNRAAGEPEDRVSPETRRHIEQQAEQLVRYLLFADEAPLSGDIRGSSGFTSAFQARGPHDAKGRSLRDFNLKTRLFEHPLSYLIYTDSFDALPEPAKGYVYERLHEVLTGSPAQDEFWWIDTKERRAILDIVLATKKGLPDSWHAPATTRRTAQN